MKLRWPPAATDPKPMLPNSRYQVSLCCGRTFHLCKYQTGKMKVQGSTLHVSKMAQWLLSALLHRAWSHSTPWGDFRVCFLTHCRSMGPGCPLSTQ